MTFFFHLHSGLRYLVLLSGAIALAYFAFCVATKKPFDKVGRIIGASYSGFLQLQVLVGIAVLVTRGYYPALIGHIVMMVLAVGSIQSLLSVNRRRTPPGYVLPLVGTVLSLLFVAGGVMAIGRSLLKSTAF